MSEREDLDLTPEEIQYLFSNIDVSIVADVVLGEQDLMSINLDSIAVTGFGWTDPIGQLQSWLMDRLRELSSWFASTVSSVFSDFYDRVIKGGLSWVINSITSGITTIASSIINTLSSVVNSVYNYLVQGVTNITKALTAMSEYWSTAIQWIVNQVTSGVKGFFDWVWSNIQSAFQGVTGFLQKIWDGISSSFQWVVSQLSGLVNAVAGLVQSGLQGLANLLQSVWNGIVSGLQSIAGQILNVINTVWSAIQSGIQGLMGFLQKMWDYIVSGLQWVASQVISGVKGFVDWLWNGLQWVGSQLSSALNAVWEWIKSGIQGLVGFLQKIWDYIVSGLQWVASQIINGVKGFIDWIWSGIQWVGGQLTNIINTVWSWIKSGIEGLVGFLGKIWDYIVNGFKWIVDQVSSGIKGFIDWVWNGLQWVGSQIGSFMKSLWAGIVSGFQGIGNTLSSIWNWMASVFNQLISGINEFTKYLYSFGAMVMGGIQNIYNFIMKIPDIFKNIFKSISDFFTWIYNGLVDFAKDPIGFLRTRIFEPILNGLRWIAEKVFEGLKWIWSGITNALTWIWNAIQGAISTLSQWIASGIAWLTQTIVGMAKSMWSNLVSIIVPIAVDFVELLKSGLSSIAKVVSKVVMEPIIGIIKSALSESGIGSPEWATSRAVERMEIEINTALIEMFGLYILGGGLAKVMGYFVKGSAMSMGSFINHLKSVLNIFGVRLELESSIMEGLGAVWYNIGEFIQSIPETMANSIMQGVAVWLGQPMARVLFNTLADYLPFYIPDISIQLELVKRGWWADKFPDVVSKKEEVVGITDFYMRLYMVPRFYRKMALSDEFYVEISDRFMQTRKIPLALRYTLPSPSEVVRWLIRDIVIPPEASTDYISKNMTKLLGIRGFSEDVAKLYYIAHFRYPPPRALGRFYFRAMAKLLWLRDSLEETAIASVVGAPTGTKSPFELNNADFKTIEKNLGYYWKWHDYAPFSWIPGFTTDKAIMMELTADLPTRIDLRWLTRWGIFEHLIKKVGSTTASIEEIRNALTTATGTEVFSSKVTPEITLDVRLLSRFLTATGYLPDVAPLLSVAQSHQVLSDEMTLVRTGFISGYREGVLTLDASEQLMSGLFIVKFKTSYFDSSSKTWVDVVYNKPLFWLPAERRLLQLRAVFDRHVDLWKDFMREVVNGVRRLAFTSSDALEYIQEFYSMLSDSWRQGVRSITGIDWSPQLDSGYINLWLKYADLTRVIEARIWIRNYLSRLMGWLLYRVSYGWLSEDDYTQLLNQVQEKEWLTPIEAEFFLTVFKWLSGVVRKEYIPTPQTLATFSEYMVIPEDVVEKVFELQKVPEEFRPLYEEYIRVRPVKSDFKSLLTAYRRAFVRGFISEDQWRVVLDEAKKYGFRDIELDIVQRIADLETLVSESSEYIPTLPQLVQFSEYVTVPDELVNQVLKERKVKEPWASMWRQLIKARTIADDVRAVLSAYVRVLRSGVVIPDDIRKQVEQYFSMVGITPDEIRIRELAVQLEMTIEYVPTLSQLVQFAEYTGIPEDLVKQVLQARRVGEPWASLWIQLIKARVVSDDVRVLVTSYYRALRSGAVIPDDVRKQVEQYFKMTGITSEELAIRDLAIQLDLLSETLPSPSTLASMAEYIDIPLDYLNEILQKRRLEKRFIDMWVRYVQVRSVSSEVNRIVSVFERLYERFSVPDALVKQVAGLMSQGGWTARELQLFTIELELRKTYRALTILVPTIRGAIGDLTYLPNYDALLQDLFTTYGLELDKYRKQLEYYRALVKNRRIWRHFSWWRTQLAYAYQYGGITLDDAKKLLAKWKDRGLVDDDEINAILEGLELRRKGYSSYRMTRAG